MKSSNHIILFPYFIIIIETYVINLQVYGFFRKLLNLWLLILCWSHVKIMLKTKKISFKLDIVLIRVVRVSVFDTCWNIDDCILICYLYGY